ncbi:glycosyltransferase family 4 protein [Flavobacteriaceae bacterium]|nr:glycosyltransferase family 4 protein [Flavobacteriaceae bacterium]
MTRKIAVICQYELLENRVGGMDQFFWAFDAKCKDHGVDIDWFFPNSSNHAAYQGLKIISADYGSMEYFFLSHIKAQNKTYDLVITHFIELSTFFAKDVKAAGIKRLIQVDHNPRPYGGYGFSKRIKKSIKGLFYSGYVDQFIGVSQNTAKEIIKDFGKRVERKTKTIYNGVNLKSIPVKNEAASSKPPKFMVVSHLRKSKGIQDLIHAVSKLNAFIKNQIVIDVFGFGPEEQELKNLVAELGCADNFIFFGSTAVVERYQEYDFLIQPSHMECMSLSILEALTAGVPVITTPVGGTPEVITPGVNGFLFEPGDTASLREIIKNCVLGDIQLQGPIKPSDSERFILDFMVEEYFKLLTI